MTAVTNKFVDFCYIGVTKNKGAENIMKKRNNFICILLTIAVILACLTGCGGDAGGEISSEGNFKMAMISSEIGSEAFNLNALNAMQSASEEHGFECISIECTDTSAWEENIMAVSEEGYDLIVGVGWNAAEPMAKAADMFPDCTYAIIDSVCANERVTSLTFREEEGAYVQGVMLATAFPEDDLFGYVCSYQTQATYKYRYGYEQGIKSVNPDAELIYNYVNSYSDTSMVYEYAVQQQAAGCNVVIGGASSAANAGIYQACLELAEKGTPTYTTGLSIDQTTSDNPYILGGLLKNTGSCMAQIIDQYMEGTLEPGEQPGGLAENAFGVVYVTTETENFRNEEIMTDEVIQAGRNAADKIISGEIVLTVPEEAAQ